MNDLNVPTRVVADVGASGLVVASLVQWLPPTAALVGILYYLLLISENRRFLQLLNFLTHFAVFHIALPKIIPTIVFRVKLIADWRNGWRWLSVQFIALAAVLQTALITFPDELRQYVPAGYMKTAVMLCLAGAFLGRFVNQKGKDNEPDKPVQS